MRKYTQSFSEKYGNKLETMVSEFHFKKSTTKLGTITESVEKEFSEGDIKIKSFTYLKENKLVSDFYKVDSENKKMTKVKTINEGSDLNRTTWEIEKTGRELTGKPYMNVNEDNSYNFKESDDKRKRPTDELVYLDKLIDYVQSELDVMKGIKTDLEYQKNNGWSEFYTCAISMNEKDLGTFEFKVNSKGIYILLVGTWVDVTIVEYDGQELISNALVAMMGFPVAGDTIKSKLAELKAKKPELFQEEDYNEEADDSIEPLYPPIGLN